MKNAAIKISIVGIEKKVFHLRCQIIRRSGQKFYKPKTFLILKLSLLLNPDPPTDFVNFIISLNQFKRF